VPAPPPGSDPSVLLPGGPDGLGDSAGLGPDGEPLLGPDGEPADPTLVGSKSIGPIPADAGIVLVDELTLSLVDIRQLKVEIQAGANTSSAQDRLASKLAGLGCISNVSKGKVRGEERKTFQMEMDNKCFFKKPEPEEDAEDAAVEDDDAESADDSSEEEDE
jgi:hypothetical protein